MTRKILALALAALPALAAARDLRPGTFELGAGTNLDFGSAKTEINGTEAFDLSTTTLSADALYYVANNFGIGLGLAYDRSKIEYGVFYGGGSTESTQWIFGPEAKLGVPLSPSVSLLFVGELGMMKVDEDGSSADGWAFGLGGGIRFFPADFVSLDALFNYTRGSVSDSASNDLTVSGWNVGVGFSFFFGGK